MFNSISKSVLFDTPQSLIVWKSVFWLILALLLYLTLTPTPPKPISLSQIDKFYHLSAFAGFTFVFTIAYKQVRHVYIILLSSILGFSIEIAQYYIPNRGFSFADMAADFAGVLIGFWFANVIRANQ